MDSTTEKRGTTFSFPLFPPLSFFLSFSFFLSLSLASSVSLSLSLSLSLLWIPFLSLFLKPSEWVMDSGTRATINNWIETKDWRIKIAKIKWNGIKRRKHEWMSEKMYLLGRRKKKEEKQKKKEERDRERKKRENRRSNELARVWIVWKGSSQRARNEIQSVCGWN